MDGALCAPRGAGDGAPRAVRTNLTPMEHPADPRRDPGLGEGAVGLLGELISLDTVNPPGNERAAQELLASRLGDAGFECELLCARDESRPNLVARLAGGTDGPTLTYLGHADTVPADASEWSFDPWVGDVAEGEVRGRGAQDMKGQVAAEVAACVSLASHDWRPERGELLLVTTADEEAGATEGAQWLCEEHADKVRSDLVVNEGGGMSFELDGRRHYALCVGEKGVFRFHLRTSGRAGHASVPALGDNALLKLAPLLARLRHQPPPEPTSAGVAFLEAVLGERVEGGNGFEVALERLRELAPAIATLLAEPMLSVTLVPTKARASEKDNVIPSRAEVLVDCRVPPGLDEAEVLERVTPVLGENGYELSFLESVVGNESSPESPLAKAISGWVERNDPGSVVVPMVMPGFSDSHWFRKAFGAATVYGFCPQREMSLFEAASLVHSADERIKVGDVELAARFYRDLAREVLG